MNRLVECVPNISEGRNKQVIDAVVEAIKGAADGIRVIDVDIGYDTNRTVITFVGEPEAVEKAAFACIKKSYELIDMSKHKGAHPRQGCTDVCPIVPVEGVTMEECVAIAKRIGAKVGDELGLPVYFYENAASTEERRDLAFVRKGEYESLPEKLKTLKPDCGSCEFNETVKKGGAVNISAREFLIAYNVNLNTRDRVLAQDIAFAVREIGRAKRNEKNEILRYPDGTSIKIPGLLKAVKGIGWYIDEYGIAQLSFNLVNYKVTPLHVLFETAVDEAAKRGLRVTGSELIGILPKEVLLETGRYYLKKAKRNPGVPESELIHLAVKSLGLNEVSKFKPEEKILENILTAKGKLCSMRLDDFVDEVGKDSPAPGGGSVSALAGALGAGLGSMVACLTPAKKGYESTLEPLTKRSERLIACLEDLKKAVDLDTEAFNDVMLALRMPKNTEEEIALRRKAMQEGYKKATLVPFNTAKRCVDALSELLEVAQIGNPNSASDVGVGALMAYAGFEGAALNVNINLPSIKDAAFKAEMTEKINQLRTVAIEHRDKVLAEVNSKIEK
ncbi:MAG TPA: glutamate formimidoyltransferase [Lentisphaeria bacterium]|nr:MAG: glutamate formimidoyltransferase [Lentisphaerae bacterium GWF2_38_69]HBM16800.1 glutamate formimidoyltransferase [Lentisphaeria bacterium]